MRGGWGRYRGRLVNRAEGGRKEGRRRGEMEEEGGNESHAAGWAVRGRRHLRGGFRERVTLAWLRG